MADIKNVLLIVVDQWRGDTLRNLGHPCIRTPAIDALCKDSVTFRNHYTQCAPCGPARASLLTGLYMMNHRVVQNGVPMDARHKSVADEARKAGYDPALVGYTTTAPDPRTTSPDDPRYRFRGALMAGWTPIAPMDPARRPYYNWLRHAGHPVPDNPEDIWLPAEGYETSGGATRAPSRVPQALSDTTWTTEHGLAYLRGVEKQPWFLHLGYFRPHPPFIAPAPYNEHYHPDEVPPPVRAETREQEAAQHPLLDHYIRRVTQRKFFQDGNGLGSEMSEQEVRVMRAAYYGLMSEVDDAIGRIVAYLKASGQYDKTLIIFTSDHAEQLGNHYLLGKIGYFDNSFHIPLIVRDPSAEADGTRGTIVDRFTETVDIMPTILDWLGQELAAGLRRAVIAAVRAGRDAGVLAQRGALRVRFPPDLRHRGEPAALRPVDRPMQPRRHPRREVQIRAFRCAAAAVLRPRGGSGAVAKPGGRSGPGAGHVGLRAQDAVLAPAPRRAHADGLFGDAAGTDQPPVTRPIRYPAYTGVRHSGCVFDRP